MTWGESLLANYTDGILVLHRGRIVYERYFGVLDAHHTAHRVLGDQVVRRDAGRDARARGPDRRARRQSASTCRSCASTGYADATIRHLLDMTTGLQFVEDYTDPNSSIWQFSRAGGFRPRPPGYQGPESFYDFIRTVAEGEAARRALRLQDRQHRHAGVGAAPRRPAGRSASCCANGSGRGSASSRMRTSWSTRPASSSRAGG